MSRTHYTGPLVVGDKQAGATGGPNIGFVECVQIVTINRDATLVQKGYVDLPAGATISSVIPDVTTAYDSATSATFIAGSADGGSQYVSGVNAKTGGRAVPSYSAAQVTAMANIGTNTRVYFTITSVGQPTVGQVVVKVHYIPTANND